MNKKKLNDAIPLDSKYRLNKSRKSFLIVAEKYRNNLMVVCIEMALLQFGYEECDK